MQQFLTFCRLLVGLAYAILNSWTAMATSLSVALPSGGPTAVIWGIVPSFIGNLAMAASMAEICHVYPTAGGQYHWSAILSPAKMAPVRHSCNLQPENLADLPSGRLMGLWLVCCFRLGRSCGYCRFFGWSAYHRCHWPHAPQL